MRHLANHPGRTKLPDDPAATAPMFFKRLLTIWFLLFTLSSSVAWAFPDQSVNGHHDPVQVDNNGHPSPLQADTCDDHCGHFSAHIVALISTAASLNSRARPTVFYFYQRIPGSRDPVPLFQPPIS